MLSLNKVSMQDIKKIPWVCSLDYKNLLDFTWFTMKFHDHHLATVHACLRSRKKDPPRKNIFTNFLQEPLKDFLNPVLEKLPASLNFDTLYNRFRSFNARNMGSVDQRAAKLLAIKLWEWFDPGTTRIRADRFDQGRGRVADFFMRPPTLKASNFAAL